MFAKILAWTEEHMKMQFLLFFYSGMVFIGSFFGVLYIIKRLKMVAKNALMIFMVFSILFTGIPPKVYAGEVSKKKPDGDGLVIQLCILAGEILYWVTDKAICKIKRWQDGPDGPVIPITPPLPLPPKTNSPPRAISFVYNATMADHIKFNTITVNELGQLEENAPFIAGLVLSNLPEEYWQGRDHSDPEGNPWLTMRRTILQESYDSSFNTIPRQLVIYKLESSNFICFMTRTGGAEDQLVESKIFKIGSTANGSLRSIRDFMAIRSDRSTCFYRMSSGN